MSDPYGTGPRIGFQATGIILNPWYVLPPSVTALDGNLPDDGMKITVPFRVELPKYGIKLFFRDDKLAFVFTDDSSARDYLINPIRYFLAYRAFINYNLFGPFRKALDEDAFEQVETIRFKVERIVRVETEEQVGGETVRGFYHDGQEAWIEISLDALIQYLNILNPSLYYALSFYLIGCQNLRYFLIEFYKAVESIKHAFGNQNGLLQSLGTYGVKRRRYKEFTKLCNDMRQAPLDIGRHAPAPNASLYSVDLRNLLVEPRSKEVFESAVTFCRQVIDAYITFLAHSAI